MYTLLIMTSMILIPIPVMMRTMLTGRNAYRGILEGSLSAISGVALVFLAFWAATGITVFEQINSRLDRVSVENMGLSGYLMGEMAQMQPDAMQVALDNMRDIAKLAVPGMLIVSCLVIAYFNYAVISWAIGKAGRTVAALPPFRTFSLPKNVVIGSLVIYLLSYITVSLGIIDKSLMMFNLEMLFTFAFSIQGLAVFFYFGHIKKLPKFLVTLIAVILFITWFGQTFLFLLGLVDVVLDIRKRISQTNLKT